MSTAHRPTFSFVLTLLVLLAAMFFSTPPNHSGDAVEYSLTTVALAKHGTPDIRLSDIETARQFAPELADAYRLIEQDIRANKETLYAAFVRGKDGDVYAVHFFGYSALATLPYKALWRVGMNPFKCYQAVNLTMIFVLGLALYRLFGNARRAWYGLALFMLCGGVLYWDWSSPECVSAAGLLAGLVLYVSGAPVWGGLLAGIAAQQNPTILFFFGFAPLLHLCLTWQIGERWSQALARAAARRQLAGLALGTALFALPPLFNLWQFGVPNIIVKLYSNSTYIGLTRLWSFFFDLNQGMLLGIPALVAMAALWGWRRADGMERADRRRHAQVLALCLAFMLAVCVPALAVLNWNSGAVGVMRYASWAAMPLLFTLLLRMRAVPHWPRLLFAVLATAQAGCMLHATKYDYVEFSPLARLVLARAPDWYHPEPEIFAERTTHTDNYINSAFTYSFPGKDAPIKRLYNRAHPGVEAMLCGAGRELGPGNRITDTYRNWSYIDGPVQCQPEDVNSVHLRTAQFAQLGPSLLASGWSHPESGGGSWDGVWTDGPQSQLKLTVPPKAMRRTLTLSGHYFNGNTRTRVKLDGQDLGWMKLDELTTIPLPAGKDAGSKVVLELTHESPAQPNAQDTRKLAFFLQQITLR